MTPFMIYLLVGALWAFICKLSGEIDRQLDESGINTVGWQVAILVAVIIFWAPVLVAIGLGKSKGEDE